LATGLLFAATGWRIGAHPALAGFLFLTAAGVALAMIDVDTKRLPNALVFPTYAVGLLAFGVDAAAGDHWWRLARAVLAMVALFSFYFVTRLLGELVLRKPAMGFGDVKLAGALGLFLGWLGWGALFVGAFAGFLVGAVGGLALVLSGRGTLASRIPYGPYMLAGAFIAVMGGQQLAHAYLRLAAG
jgi:leader peptidase (prepilin peptidase)/N-methyltransferase